MAEDYIEERLKSFVERGLYDQAIGLIRRIRDPERRVELYFSAVAWDILNRITEEYGKIVILDDKAEYERAKIGMEDCSPYAVLYQDENGLHGIEDMLDFILEDNPLIQLCREPESDE